MIAIELLEDTTTASMFVRVVYNGKVAKVPWDVCGPHGGNERKGLKAKYLALAEIEAWRAGRRERPPGRLRPPPAAPAASAV